MTGAELAACEDRLYALLAERRPRIIRMAGWLARADTRIAALLHRGMPPERTPAPMTDRHHVVHVDTRYDAYRTAAARHYAFCTKDGCRFWWNGIGRLEPVKAEHEALNDTDPAAEPEMAADHVF